MRLRKWHLTCGLALILLAASACSFTTANISSLKLSKDEKGESETSTFAPGETIYARATVSNVPSKVTLKWQLIAEKVQGQQENYHVPQLDKSFDIPNDGVGTYSLSPPPAGWPAGKYRIEVGMFIENGQEKDHKTTTFTVSGG